MDCTTQLGMLRERRQRGHALLAGQRVVLCSQSWPLLVSQSTALQGGADVVAACTTEAEAEKTRAAAPPAPTHQPRPAATGIRAPIGEPLQADPTAAADAVDREPAATLSLAANAETWAWMLPAAAINWGVA